MNQPNLNYENEAKEVQDGGDWIKLTVGVHKITVLSDFGPLVKKEINGDPVEQSEALVEYQGSRKKWQVNKGKSTKSLWGQLMVLGKHHKTLVGVPLDVIVKESKDKNGDTKKDYTILQCSELMQKQATLQKQ